MSTEKISIRQRDMIQQSLMFLTAVWTENGCLESDPGDIEDVLGGFDYKELALGLAGIAQYFAGAVARLEGQINGTWIEPSDVLEGLCREVALQMMEA